MYIPSNDEIKEFVTRGVSRVVPKDEFISRILAGDRMRVYLGADPTRPDLHLGHAVVLWKMARLQEWGHEIVFLVGDFTAQIGDPSGRDAMRQPMTQEEIKKNAKTYQEQVKKIVRFDGENPARLEYNSTWLSSLTFQDVVELAGRFTVQQMIERDMFQERLRAGRPIGLHEFLYPLMQGYDSVAMEVDMEMGGSDQLFNMMAGRTLLASMKGKSKVVFTCELLEGTDGRKMSKSYDNVINVFDGPQEMYGKIMSLKDELIERYFVLCTDVPLSEIRGMVHKMSTGSLNPRDAKARLAHTIVSRYHTPTAADNARDSFERVFREHNIPKDIPEVKISSHCINPQDLLVCVGLAKSKSEARRLIDQGGVRINQQVISSWKEDVQMKSGDIVQVGKRKFVRIR